jgi:uncharacterized membrane protein YGL010W
MTKLGALLDEYEESHRHPVNIKIHWVAEPLAIFAVMALAWSAPFPGLNLLWPFLALLLTYFARLSLRVTAAFLPIVIVYVLLIVGLERIVGFATWKWALPVFVISWLALLGGHRIEGRVPSVFQNPNLIFVGPAWLARRVFRRIGWDDP